MVCLQDVFPTINKINKTYYFSKDLREFVQLHKSPKDAKKTIVPR